MWWNYFWEIIVVCILIYIHSCFHFILSVLSPAVKRCMKFFTNISLCNLQKYTWNFGLKRNWKSFWKVIEVRGFWSFDLEKRILDLEKYLYWKIWIINLTHCDILPPQEGNMILFGCLKASVDLMGRYYTLCMSYPWYRVFQKVFLKHMLQLE